MYTNIIHNDDICNYFLKNQQFIFNSLGNCRECRLYALFRLPKARHVAKAFMWLGIVVSVLTGVLLIVSAIHAWGMVDMLNITQEEINAVQTSIMTPDPDPVIHDLFQKTMHWLMDTSKGNVGYNAINLLIYVLLMPVLIITSIFVCLKTSKKYSTSRE